MNNNLPLMPPDLNNLLSDDFKNNIFASINCCEIGKIESVNYDEQTVSIQIQVKRRTPDGIISYPVLGDCPFFVLQGGGAYIDMPISKGDYCIVLFNDRNIDTWWSTANVAEPPTKRKHSLSDGIAIVGINPKPRALDFDGTQVRILGKSGPGAEQPAARKEDEITITAVTDPAFFSWMSAVASAAGGPSPPSSITGKISSGSTGVKIG
jgi:hypothetical protein